MHPISFQFKRAHLSAVAMGRKLFRGTKDPLDPAFDGVHDMTPARFDILHVISSRYQRVRDCPRPDCMEMAQVRKELGLHPSTMTVAVRRLIELGLVTAEKAEHDKRKTMLTLTPEGRRRIRRAYHLVFTGRTISRHYRAFIGKRVSRNVKNRLGRIDYAIDQFWFYDLVGLGRHLGDKANTVYRFRYESDN